MASDKALEFKAVLDIGDNLCITKFSNQKIRIEMAMNCKGEMLKSFISRDVQGLDPLSMAKTIMQAKEDCAIQLIEAADSAMKGAL